MNKKINVCLLFGGKSGEHEVSLQSAKSVYEALDKNKYNITLIGIDKTGRWLLPDETQYLLNATNPKLIKLNTKNSTTVTAIAKQGETQIIPLSTNGPAKTIDVVLPIMHGTYGEDGAMQGFLELIDVAYVGAGILGSAIGMDKDVMKRLLRDADIPIARFFSVRKSDMNEKKWELIDKYFTYPVFVKPANAGSSVGVSKAKNREELQTAIDEAFRFDTKVLIEEYIKGREIECSVLGNDEPIASLPGEVIPQHEFYSYDAKYIDENGAKLEIPAQIPHEIIKKIQDMATKAFKVLECSGMARVDFFLTEDERVYLNEINTIPGFTKISMYPKLWDVSGISYSELLDKLIQLAIERKKEKDILQRSYV